MDPDINMYIYKLNKLTQHEFIIKYNLKSLFQQVKHKLGYKIKVNRAGQPGKLS